MVRSWVSEYLCSTCGDRPHFGFGVVGQFLAYRLQDLRHLRACPIDVGSVVEYKCDDGESASRDASALLDARDIGESHLHGSSDVLFHLLRSERRSLGYHLHLVVGDVGSGVERQMNERPHTPHDKGKRGYTHNELVVDGICDEFLKHDIKTPLLFSDYVRRVPPSCLQDRKRCR